MKKILAISAHSDDVEFYAGGTLARAVEDGDEVYLVVATDGRYGTHKNIRQKELIERRKTEQNEAAKILGFKEVVFLQLADCGLETEIKKLKKLLLRTVMRVRPDEVYSFDPYYQHVAHEDFHPDHRTLAHAVLDVLLIDATLPQLGGLNGFEPGIVLFDAFAPNMEVNITAWAKKKRQVLEMFGTQADVLDKQVAIFKSEKFLRYRPLTTLRSGF